MSSPRPQLLSCCLTTLLLFGGALGCAEDLPGGPTGDALISDAEAQGHSGNRDAGSGSATDGGLGGKDGSVSEDGSSTGADGGVDLDGTAGTDGGGSNEDGGGSTTDGGGNSSDGGSSSSDGSSSSSDGSSSSSDGSSSSSDGSSSSSDGGSSSSDGGSSSSDGGGNTSDGSSTNADGSASDGGAAVDGASGVDGGTGADGGAGGDAGAGDADPLDGSLTAFCQGSGTVVEIGAGLCSGDVAQQTFRFAVCTCRNLNVQSNLLVDAFDSANGPYGGANVLADGHTGVNADLFMPGRLTQRGSVFVSGGGFSVGQQSEITVNVFTNGDAVQTNSLTTIGRNAFVNGDVAGRYDILNDLSVPVGATIDPQTLANLGGVVNYGPIPSITPCPCAPDEILDIASIVAFGATYNDNAEIGLDPDTWATGTGPSTLELPCGRYYLRGIFHPQSLTIRALGRTVLYIDGDYTVSGSLRLEVAAGAEIDVFVAGSLAAGAALRFGDEERPSAVRTYVAGAAPLFIQANSLFGGNFYAPNAVVSFSAATDIYGALFANDIVFGGNAAVHYDRDVRSAGDECPPSGGGPDAGATNDAGTANDAGQDPDAGDAGPPPQSCDVCDDCGGGIACLNTGLCGPCVTDLDCCPNEVCEQGFCTSPF